MKITEIKWLKAILISQIIICSTCTANFAVDHINYRLKWLFNSSVVGDLYAKEYGLFQDAGLKVTVKAGGPERDAIREIELGHAQFGVASADQVIRALSKGAPVVVIAQIFQENPLQWIYRKEAHTLNHINDLRGKAIGITYGGNDETIMRALLAKAGIKNKEVKFYSVRYDYTPFYQKKVAIWPVYRNAQGIIISEKLKNEGETVQFFNPSDQGVKFVANSVVTSKQMINKHPEIVRKFVTSLLMGWIESLAKSNEKQSLSVLKKYDRDTSTKIQNNQLSVTRKLVAPDSGKNIGYIDIEAWKQTEQIMIEQKLISRPVQVENILIQVVH